MTSYLTPKEAAEYLVIRGVKIAPTTLNKLRCTGGGPAFRKIGRYAVYSPADLDAWINERISEPVASTSELRAVS